MDYDLHRFCLNFYSHGVMTYLLESYVEKEFWTEKLKKIFYDCSIINLTDFTYSKCFTLLVSFNPIHSNIGTAEYSERLIEETLYAMRIEISAIGPFAVFWFVKQYRKDSKEYYFQQEYPFLREHNMYSEIMDQFIKQYNLQKLSKEQLIAQVPELSLELSQENTTIYNCLFHDSSS